MELNEAVEGLVHEQDAQEDGQEDSLLLQGDQGSAEPWDVMTFRCPLSGGVEVVDAEEEEKGECEEDKFWLQRESLEVGVGSVRSVGDLLSAANFSCAMQIR